MIFTGFIGLLLCSEPFSEQKKDKNYSIKNYEAIVIVDGLMVDGIWNEISIMDDYVQEFPYNGENASFDTEVRMFYSKTGIYIFARMHDDNPNMIQERLAKYLPYFDRIRPSNEVESVFLQMDSIINRK